MDPKMKDLQNEAKLNDDELLDFLNGPEEAIDLPAPKQEESEIKENKPQNTKVIKSHRERARERADKFRKDQEVQRAAKALALKRAALIRATSKFKKKRSKIRKAKLTMREIKKYDAELDFKEFNEGNRTKITPDIEKMLFPFYIAGASLASIQQQFGQKYGFGIASLNTARDFYKWRQRKEAISRVTRSTNDLDMSERFKDYQNYFDDILSEAIIRFKNNSMTGQNTNPFNTLKATNVKDLKDLLDMITALSNREGFKKTSGELSGNKPELSAKKRSKLLEVLAEDDEDEENSN